MFGLLFTIATTLVIAWVSHGAARRFVRERLRYVESALKPAAAVVAGLVAALVAIPIFGFVHMIPLVGWLVGSGTGVAVGLSVGLGVRSGASDVKRGYVIGPGA